MWLIPSIKLPKKGKSVSSQGKTMLSLNVCAIINDINFTNVKLHSFQLIFLCFHGLCPSNVQKPNFGSKNIILVSPWIKRVLFLYVFFKVAYFQKQKRKPRKTKFITML